MNKLFKIYSGATIVLLISACSGQYQKSSVNLSSKSNQSITAKSFLSMNSEEKQNVLNQFQEKCEAPEVLNQTTNFIQSSNNTQAPETCFKICKIKVIGPVTEGSTNISNVSTKQVYVDANYLITYLENETIDRKENIFGECNIIPPCHFESLPIMTITDTSETTDSHLEDPLYCSTPIVYEGQLGSVDGDN